MLCERTGAVLKVIPNQEGTDHEYDKLLSEKLKLLQQSIFQMH
jgi:hypothetical protein